MRDETGARASYRSRAQPLEAGLHTRYDRDEDEEDDPMDAIDLSISRRAPPSGGNMSWTGVGGGHPTLYIEAPTTNTLLPPPPTGMAVTRPRFGGGTPPLGVTRLQLRGIGIKGTLLQPRTATPPTLSTLPASPTPSNPPASVTSGKPTPRLLGALILDGVTRGAVAVRDGANAAAAAVHALPVAIVNGAGAIAHHAAGTVLASVNAAAAPFTHTHHHPGSTSTSATSALHGKNVRISHLSVGDAVLKRD